MSVEVMELFTIFSKTFSKEDAQTAVKDIETLISDHKRELATKADLERVESSLKADLERVESSLKGDTERVESSLKGDIREVELKLTKEIKEVELKLTKEIEAVRLEVEKAKSSLVRWFAGLLIAYTGVIITVLTLLK
jgi:hypothetical protein